MNWGGTVVVRAGTIAALALGAAIAGLTLGACGLGTGTHYVSRAVPPLDFTTLRHPFKCLEWKTVDDTENGAIVGEHQECVRWDHPPPKDAAQSTAVGTWGASAGVEVGTSIATYPKKGATLGFAFDAHGQFVTRWKGSSRFGLGGRLGYWGSSIDFGGIDYSYQGFTIMPMAFYALAPDWLLAGGMGLVYGEFNSGVETPGEVAGFQARGGLQKIVTIVDSDCVFGLHVGFTQSGSRGAISFSAGTLLAEFILSL